MEKMTQRDMFNEVIALAKENGRDDLVEFAEGRIALLDKKSANKKPSKVQEGNKVLAEIVLAVMPAEGATVSEIMARDERLAALSNQKVSAILRTLVADNKVEKTVDKKRALFSRVA